MTAILQEMLVQQALRNNREVLTVIDPSLFSDDDLSRITKYITALEVVSFDAVRSAINQDKAQQWKDGLLKRVKVIEFETYAYYSEAMADLRYDWVCRNVRTYAERLSHAGTDECTKSDIEKYVTQLYEVFKHGDDTKDIHTVSVLVDEVLARTKEEINELRLSLSNHVLRKGFADYLRPRLYVVSGKSSMGKSIIADNLAAELGKMHPGIYYSFDNSRHETMTSILSVATGIAYNAIDNNILTDDERIGVDKARKRLKMFVSDRKKTAQEIRVDVEKLRKAHDVRWVILDYFTNIRLPKEHDVVRQFEAAAIELKAICHDFGMSVIVLSQVNNDGELKWCRGLFQECFYNLRIDGERESNNRELTVEKFKKGGLTSFNIAYNASVGELWLTA